MSEATEKHPKFSSVYGYTECTLPGTGMWRRLLHAVSILKVKKVLIEVKKIVTSVWLM